MKLGNIVATYRVIAFIALPVAAHGSGMMEGAVDTLFNLRDQHQANVMKSVHGVREAMEEGGPRGEQPGESTRHYLERKHNEYKELYLMDKNLCQEQRALKKIDIEILSKLSPGDPKRHEIAAEINNLSRQIPATKESALKFGHKAQEFNAELNRYNQRHGP